MITRRSFTWGTAIAGFGLTAGAASAQDFPARPVTLIVAVQAGTSADASLRALAAATEDRKSTRLNSSHEWISYAVFCLKKKRKIVLVGPARWSWHVIQARAPAPDMTRNSHRQ